MTTPRVQRQRQADANRRRVNTRGKRVQRAPRQQAPKARRPSYKKSGALAGLSVVFSGLCFATGSLFWAVGAVTTSAASGYVARQTYKRELAQVKATGRPIGAPDPARPAAQPNLARRPRDGRKQPGPSSDHATRCTAKSKSTCRCPDGPNRQGKNATTKRATGARRKTT